MVKPKKIFLIIACFILAFFLLTNFVSAQRQLEINYPEVGGIKPQVTTISLPLYVKYIFNISIALAGLVAFGALVYAGFRYLTAAGNMAAIRDAKERIGSAVLGLLILSGSYLILTTINPQLTFFDLPELKSISIPSSLTVPAKDDVLSYTEIPLAGLVADLLSKTRIDNIKSVSENIKTSVGSLKNLNEQLKKSIEEENILAVRLAGATDACVCQNTYTKTGYCAYNAPCPASGPNTCSGDPCAQSRGVILGINSQIEQKKEEIKQNSILITAGLNDLKYWQNKFDAEAGVLTKAYQGLLDAKKKIADCSGSISPKGKAMELMSYNDFWQYREFLEKQKLIKSVDASQPWSYIKADSATLYCAEQFYSTADLLPSSLPSEEELKKIIQEIPGLQEKNPLLKGQESFCGVEIPIGQAVEDAQALTEKIAGLLLNISQKTEDIFSNATDMMNEADKVAEIKNFNALIGEIQSYSCTGSCVFYPPVISCSGNPRVCRETVPARCFVQNPCTGVPGTRSSANPKNEIKNRANQFTAIYSRVDGIFVSFTNNYEGPGGLVENYQNLDDLIKEINTEDRLKISEILDKLNISKNKMGACYNSAETQYNMYQGKKVIWKDLYSCSQVKLSAQGQIPVFDQASGQPITDCYSGQGKADNYFCCSTEVNPNP